METARKITVEVPQELLEKAQRAATCCGIADMPTQAPRQGSLLAHVGRAQGRPMIAADTSTWVAFLEGGAGDDAQLLDKALEDRQVGMVPAALTELLSEFPFRAFSFSVHHHAP